MKLEAGLNVSIADKSKSKHFNISKSSQQTLVQFITLIILFVHITARLVFMDFFNTELTSQTVCPYKQHLSLTPLQIHKTSHEVTN